MFFYHAGLKCDVFDNNLIRKEGRWLNLFHTRLSHPLFHCSMPHIHHRSVKWLAQSCPSVDRIKVLHLISVRNHHFRACSGSPRLKDEAEVQHQLEAKQAEIAAYRAYREEVESRREEDRQGRNAAKVKQIQLFEQLQVKDIFYIALGYRESFPINVS